ncbi:MAG: hypothetical protein NT150_07980 [Bacteroidetes bacterium]|nr:hypothetical protein [Bacteroidota bacterium]
MKKIFYTSFLCLIMIGFCSCEKEYTTTVKGQVIDADTKQPIANAKVKFVSTIPTSCYIACSETESYSDEIHTNDYGNFELSITSTSRGGYIIPSKSNYSPIGNDPNNNDYTDISGGGVHDVVLEMKRRPSLTLVLQKKSSPSTDSDVLNVTFLQNYSNYLLANWGPADPSLNHTVFIGKGPFTYYMESAYPSDVNISLPFKISLSSSTGWISKYDTIYIGSNIEYTDTIYY